MTVVTRFAPSPTGDLHIGGARTALFNWLYARHNGGRMLLRIEDTDRARSTEAAVEAIYDGLRWLGLDWDGEAISQFARAGRHAAVAEELLAAGKAYRCYHSQEELAQMRQQARAEGRAIRSEWRDRDGASAPAGEPYVIRLRAPDSGATSVDDLVQGMVTVQNAELDDMVLLRSDGTPTYMLAVVVDDHDMEISHVIRGDDHLTNAIRQRQIYDQLGWAAPAFAHIPLIHGPDGAKLSKRHGALGVEAYREMGYLPEALRNYLVRLGWSHGDDEIFSTEQAIAWFDLDGVGRAPARFDFAKLESLNSHYLRARDDDDLVGLVEPWLRERTGRPLSEAERRRLLLSMADLKERAKTLVDLADRAGYCVAERPLAIDDKARKLLDDAGRAVLDGLAAALAGQDVWTAAGLEETVRGYAERESLKFGKVAQPLRAALTGTTTSPGIFDVLLALGREESLGRIADAAAGRNR